MSKMWGGRFSKKIDPLVEDFTKSIQFDSKLAEYDCIGSLAHIDVLKKAKLLKVGEHKKLKQALKGILASIKEGSFKPDNSFEDIHSYIQHLVEKKVGKFALKLHTCRSRNDQVVFDTKCYCMENISLVTGLISKFNKTLSKLALSNKNIYIAGYTHLQHAMPVSLGNYFGAYNKMLARDAKRMNNVFKNIELCMGAGALAGTMIDVSKYYKDTKPFKITAPDNSIDAVSDRDFLIETLSALAIIGMHLSRLAEDLILWSTKEFDFIDIDESFCTGSSLMPQKKNPDVLELIRGYSGRLYGNLLDVLVVMKGLPLAYNRDMQLDKEPLFSSFEIVQRELKVLTELLLKIKFKKENIAKQLKDECLYATDMADYLVQKGVAFRDAHTIIGKLIRYKLDKGKKIVDMKDDELRGFHPLLSQRLVSQIINPEKNARI